VCVCVCVSVRACTFSHTQARAHSRQLRIDVSTDAGSGGHGRRLHVLLQRPDHDPKPRIDRVHAHRRRVAFLIAASVPMALAQPYMYARMYVHAVHIQYGNGAC